MIRKLHTPPLILYKADTSTRLEIPMLGSISAGFPSPADDFLDASIDLNKALIKNNAATYFMRAVGNSMKGAGIDDGDLLIIDRSITPKNNTIAICSVDGEYTVKRIKIDKDIIWLMPANNEYQPIKVAKDDGLTVFGIVTTVIKSL